MDFLDPKKKRNHLIRLYVGYFLIAIIIGFGSLILFLQSYGYGVDRKTGDIIQNGLLFVAAQPEAADVVINGRQYTTKDNARLVLPADSYTLELRRDGYRSWKRTFTLLGGSIERLVYPFLFPEKLDTVDKKLYASAPGFATQSPDRRWILVQQPGQLSTFDVFDANNPTAIESALTVPASLFTASTQHTLKLVEWSTNNRHILVEHVFKEGHEFVIIDRETPATSVNINKVFTRTPQKVTLRDKRFDRLYLYDQTTKRLELGELPAATLKPVLEGVLAYKTHGDDMIVYATSAGAPSGKTRIMIRDNDGSYTLRDTPTDTAYLLDIARYDGRWYIATGTPSDSRVYIYKDPLVVVKHQPNTLLIPATVLRVDKPTHVSFSANAQFLAAEGEGGTKFAVYDAENDRSYRYELKEQPDPGQYAQWMDGNRLTVTTKGKLVVFDYDGINARTLTANTLGFVPFFDRDYRILYNISPSTSVTGRHALTRTNLKIVPSD